MYCGTSDCKASSVPATNALGAYWLISGSLAASSWRGSTLASCAQATLATQQQPSFLKSLPSDSCTKSPGTDNLSSTKVELERRKPARALQTITAAILGPATNMCAATTHVNNQHVTNVHVTLSPFNNDVLYKYSCPHCTFFETRPTCAVWGHVTTLWPIRNDPSTKPGLQRPTCDHSTRDKAAASTRFCDNAVWDRSSGSSYQQRNQTQ